MLFPIEIDFPLEQDEERITAILHPEQLHEQAEHYH